MPTIRFEHISKKYEPDSYALAGLNLTIGPGELVTLVGPSGCGKSTALRVLAGLESATEGHVLIDERVVDDLPTRRRGLGLVTQDNALVRQLTARRNIALPLVFRGADPEQQKLLVEALASDLAIGHLLRRRPGQLSGGEIQAVQLARSIVALPDIWLLDEPLGRLDPHLRRALRGDIVRLHRALGASALVATADQADATVMSSRVAMLDHGRLQQVGAPSDLLDSPVNLVVARFFGEPTMNIVRASVADHAGQREYRMLDVSLPAWPEVTARYAGRELLVGLRPHELLPADAAPRAPRVRATVARVDRLGADLIAHLRTADGTELRWSTSETRREIGTQVEIVLRPDRFHLFDPATGAALWHPPRTWP